MLVNVDSSEVLIVSLFALALVSGIGILLVKSRSLRQQRLKTEARMIKATIIDYFGRSGVDVSVGCVALEGTRRYTVFIESEPMKRFRLSHIIEATLVEYIMQTCRLELDKIYWRFPIKEEVLRPVVPDEASQSEDHVDDTDIQKRLIHEDKPEEPVDDYINEGLLLNQHLKNMHVTELPWEKFEEVTAHEAEKKAP